MSPKVSVVVPIYNVEPYLSQCVESLLTQTLRDMEIVLVDDGSPDRCGEIADGFAQDHSNVKVIHQSNAGLGPARNSGMSVATGEYIGFVDSDDWVMPTMFEKLYKAAKRVDADICVGGYREVSDGRIIGEKIHPNAGRLLTTSHDVQYTREQLFGHLPGDVETEAFPMQVWTSIYRRAFVQSDGLRFRNILSEDTVFNLDAYNVAKTITFIGETSYCYRMGDHPSIMRTFSENKLLQYEEFIRTLYREAENTDNAHNACVRVKYAAIQYIRLYAGIVEKSNLNIGEKISHLRTLTRTDMMKKYSSGYPVEMLPKLQRIFQKTLSNKHYMLALCLLWGSRLLKHGK